MNDVVWYVYMLDCGGSIYTGITPHLDQRVDNHVKGSGALFTKLNKPTALLAAKPFKNHIKARQVEAQIKQMRKSGKLMLASIWSKQHPIDETTQKTFSFK